jgi:hypothetical protein
MAELNFKASEVPEDEGFEVIPAGTYAAQIIESDMKETKAKTGMYLELRIQILDAPYTGRLVFERLNLVNPNETAVKIANRTLADICEACGLDEVEDSEELHGLEFEIDLVVEPAKGDWGESNKVKKYKKAS